MTGPRLRPARREELAALSDLCRASKAVWGYDAAFMDACRDELTLQPRDLPDLIVVECDGHAAGVAAVQGDGPVLSLEKFFVAPERIGTGLGRVLFDGVRAEVRRRGARVLEIEADPGARPFYERMGAVVTGSAPSGSIPGRVLPKLTYSLQSEATS